MTVIELLIVIVYRASNSVNVTVKLLRRSGERYSNSVNVTVKLLRRSGERYSNSVNVTVKLLRRSGERYEKWHSSYSSLCGTWGSLLTCSTRDQVNISLHFNGYNNHMF